MEHVVKFGNARVTFKVDEYDHAEDGEESFGGGNAGVCLMDWHRVYWRQKFELYGVDANEMARMYRDPATRRDAVYISNDDFIVFMDAISREPRRNYIVTWNGLSYWLFHDLTHAKHDVYGGSVNVNDIVEDRTLYEGAMMARKHGVPLGQIIRELVRSEQPYLDRFRRPTTAMDRFLHEVDSQ